MIAIAEIAKQFTPYYQSYKELFEDNQIEILLNKAPYKIYVNNISKQQYGLLQPDQFWHLASFGKDEKQFEMYPCTNLDIKSKCKTDCDLTIKQFFNNRTPCLYRAQLIPLVRFVIEAFNSKSKDILSWTTPDKERSNCIKLHLWHYNKIENYEVIIQCQLKNGNLINPRLVTAFPVILKRKIEENKRNYSKYKYINK